MSHLDSSTILETIQNGNPFSFHKHAPTREFDEELIQILDSLTEYYEIPDFSPLFYTIVKDLILNGFKANYKRIFFLENHLDIESPADYELGVRMYKSFILSGKSSSYEPLAKERNFFVDTFIEHNSESIIVTIRNNSKLARGEMLKIKNSLIYAQDYNDIMEYYIERGDSSEGEGIGIALCILLLKGEGIPTENFRITSINDETIASVRIPLKKN